jgi:hypothetical protein
MSERGALPASGDRHANVDSIVDDGRPVPPLITGNVLAHAAWFAFSRCTATALLAALATAGRGGGGTDRPWARM